MTGLLVKLRSFSTTAEFKHWCSVLCILDSDQSCTRELHIYKPCFKEQSTSLSTSAEGLYRNGNDLFSPFAPRELDDDDDDDLYNIYIIIMHLCMYGMWVCM